MYLPASPWRLVSAGIDLVFDLIQTINSVRGTDNYEPYSMDDVEILIGAPPGAYPGVHSIRATRNQPKAKLFKCFTQNGAFVSNRDISGVIQIVVAPESPLHSALQVLDLSGIGFPIYATDTGTAGSSFIASTSSRVINTPIWTKSRSVQLVTYTIECKRLAVNGGIRKVVRL